MKCKLCGTNFIPGEDKFCQSCGRELPQITAPAENPEEDTKNAGPNTAIGKNSILSNSQINTSNTTNTTTVNNTTVEDDTKKTIVCAVSGKRVLYTESICCRGCNKDVSLEFYNEKTRKCDNCYQENIQQYKNSFKDALESGGGIDRQERAELDILAQRLNLSEKDKSSIEAEIKSINSLQSGNDEAGFDDLFDIELSIVKKDLFKKNDLSSALLRLKQIYDQVQTNDEISCIYFLLKAIKSPDMYVTNFEGAMYDEFWENYWLFIAHIKKGDHTKGLISIKKNHTKFPHKKNEIALSEIVYFIMRFQFEQNDVLIDTANEKISMIESISGNLLTKLYKSNEKLLSSFDYGLLKFTNLTPPEEPGVKEYFQFFINHLYKITPEQPKSEKVDDKPVIDNKNSVIAEIPKKENFVQEAPKIPTKPHLPFTNHATTEVVIDKKQSPKLPSLPNAPKPIEGAKNHFPKVPQMPIAPIGKSGPKIPTKPAIPTPASPPTNKVVLPKIPQIPGKK